MSMLKQKASSMDAFKRHGGLIVDEMTLSENLSVSLSGHIQGFVNMGQFTPSSGKHKVADHTMVIMLVPFTGKWTQILPPFATHGNMKGNLLSKVMLKAVILAGKAGLFVDFISSDGATWNQNMYSMIDTVMAQARLHPQPTRPTPDALPLQLYRCQHSFRSNNPLKERKAANDDERSHLLKVMNPDNNFTTMPHEITTYSVELGQLVEAQRDECKRKWQSLRDRLEKNWPRRKTNQAAMQTMQRRRKRTGVFKILEFLAPFVSRRRKLYDSTHAADAALVDDEIQEAAGNAEGHAFQATAALTGLATACAWSGAQAKAHSAPGIR
ncbi:hypothetical protein HPB48_014480 [Haemaphysalis longicornis]|uniref:Transposable element P transposase-like RNase H domain-containing protein n=1 Tax=Haemaphysalis longicornis TaxID=44386 RepID=A0A9J6GAY7_HAELO|nr:hypothetical protein HPB48_014480 [Haemaphysalis longicornis]